MYRTVLTYRHSVVVFSPYLSAHVADQGGAEVISMLNMDSFNTLTCYAVQRESIREYFHFNSSADLHFNLKVVNI